MRSLVWLAPLALALLAACPGPPGPAQVFTPSGEPTGAIYGVVRVPRALVPSPSAAPGEEAPTPRPDGPLLGAAGADVFVGDVRGTRLPGTPPGKANADGSYRLRGIPLGYAYVVTAVWRDAGGRVLRLRTLAKPMAGDLEAPLDLATSLVAHAALADATGLLPGLTPETWARAVAAASKGLDPAKVPDLGDPAAMAAELARLTAADAALKADIEALRAELGPGTPAPFVTAPPTHPTGAGEPTRSPS